MFDQLFNEVHVVFATGEVTASTQQESLIDSLFEVAVGGLNVAVFIGAPGLVRSD